MSRKTLILITIIITLLATKGLALEVRPQNASGYPQETVTVSINVIGATKAIGALGMVVTYNSTRLSFESLSKAALTAKYDKLEANELEPGRVRIGGFGVDVPAPSDATLVNLNFKIRGGASGDCEISLLEFVDDLEGAATTPAKVTIYSAETPDIPTQNTTPPLAFHLTSPNDIWINNSSPTFTWSPSLNLDDESGIVYHLYLNGTLTDTVDTVSTKPFVPLPDGSYIWRVEAEAGNGQGPTTFSDDTFTVKIDTLAPTTKLVVAPLGYVSNQIRYIKPNAILNLSTSDDTGSGISSVSYQIDERNCTSSITIREEGEHSIKCLSTDVAGNEGAETFTVFVDQTPPVTSDDAPLGWRSDTVTVNLTSIDTGCGAAFTCYTTNGDTPTTASDRGKQIILGQDGIHEISYFSVDNLGNTEAPRHAEVKINRFPPKFLSGYFDPQKKQLILHFSKKVRQDTDTGAQIKINGEPLTEDETVSETGGGRTLIIKSDTVAVIIKFGEGSIRDLEGNPILDVSEHLLYLLVEKKDTLKGLTIENRSGQTLAFSCKDENQIDTTLSQTIQEANKKAEADPKISKMIGAAYQIEAITPQGEDCGENLPGPILLEIPYEEEDDINLRAYRLNKESPQWELIEDGEINEPDGSKNVVRVEVDHLSLFSLGIAKQAAPDLTGAKVFPNPFIPGNATYGAARMTSGIIFDELTEDAEIKIFTIAGELVKTLRAENGEATWGAVNENEREVASGIYIYLITDSQNGKKTGKIAIIR